MTLHTPLRASRRRSLGASDAATSAAATTSATASSSGPGGCSGSGGMDGDGESNIKVVVRCRPPSAQEKAAGRGVVVQCNAKDRHVVVAYESRGVTAKKTYTFDTVHGQFAQQDTVFDDLASVVDEVLQGFNCTVFAYGQTGTGKTYTMQGLDMATDRNDATLGIVPRSIHAIFDRLESKDAECVIHVSCLEIYNEILVDLLSDTEMEHRIFEDAAKGVFVSNLEELLVREPNDIFEVLEQSWKRRQTGETKMNKNSSRSHTIFTVKVHSKETNSDGEDVIKIGKLNLVDLAGSECIGKSEAVGKRAKEAGNINRSLLTLGRVINALVQGHRHVPYRESKLTRLLQESLGGKAKTVLVATISPSSSCLDETLKTLDYAHTAKNIKNRPQVNQKVSHKAYVRDLQLTIANYKKTLDAMRTKTGVYMPNEQYEEILARVEGERGELDQTKATLRECEMELGKARDANQQLRTELEQSRQHAHNVQQHMAAAFQREQDALLHSARQMHRQLRHAIDGGDRMRQSIERRAALERQNRVQVDGVAQRVGGVVDTLERIVREYVASFITVCGTMQQHTHEFAAARLRSAAELRGIVAQHTAELGSAAAAASNASTAAATVADAHPAAVGDALSSAADAVSQQHAAAVAAVAAGCNGAQTVLDTLVGKAAATASETGAGVAAFTARIADNAANLAELVAQTHQVIGDIFASFVKELASLRASIESAAAAEADTAATAAQQLSADIGALVHAFVERRGAAAADAALTSTRTLDRLVSTVTSSNTDTNDVFDVVARTVRDAHTDYASRSAALAQPSAALCTVLVDDVRCAAQQLDSVAPAATAALQPAAAAVAAARAGLGDAARAVAGAVRNAHHAVDAGAARVDAVRGALRECVAHCVAQCEAACAARCDAATAANAAAQCDADAAACAHQAQVDAVRAALAAFGDPTHALGFRVYEPTLATPTKVGELGALPPSPKHGRVWSDALGEMRETCAKRRRVGERGCDAAMHVDASEGCSD